MKISLQMSDEQLSSLLGRYLGEGGPSGFYGVFACWRVDGDGEYDQIFLRRLKLHYQIDLLHLPDLPVPRRCYQHCQERQIDSHSMHSLLRPDSRRLWILASVFAIQVQSLRPMPPYRVAPTASALESALSSGTQSLSYLVVHSHPLVSRICRSLSPKHYADHTCSYRV